jgi:hypothetical protein
MVIKKIDSQKLLKTISRMGAIITDNISVRKQKDGKYTLSDRGRDIVFVNVSAHQISFFEGKERIQYRTEFAWDDHTSVFTGSELISVDIFLSEKTSTKLAKMEVSA